MSDRCRIIVDPEPAVGAWNMAVDEVLLERALDEGVCSVRWYQWSEPTLSLGYFQTTANVSVPERLSCLPLVRRLSGGGAIVHHHELTYSCAVPAAHKLARDPRQLYTAVHQRVIAVLAQIGIPAALRGAAKPTQMQEFLCFGRGDDFDVIVGDHKVLGSAQRRRKGCILQHGSLILGRSEHASEFPGVSDLVGREVSAAALLERLPEAVASLFAETPGRETLSRSEREQTAIFASRTANLFDNVRGD